ncbi:TolC family protein [Hanstruepera ponticola]|uniref:TolC family protein n=1 Tax=Hanstruepera ponticola TaxID=2042995 RepID=UPI0017828A3E|nr:TolC family protein [Hanstruepera ponticola]
MKQFVLGVFLSFSLNVSAQQLIDTTMTLSEYLGYVKAFHPIVKQANLIVNESELKLLKSRGAFDPKIEVDYDRKKFENTEYYDKLNATFKIPTWYGLEFKGNFEENEGVYLNPEATVPNDGLYSVGVSIDIARGLIMNERMSMLKQAKLFVQQAEMDRQLLVNDILFEASVAYFNWLKAYNEKKVYESFVENASLRFNGVKKSYEVGERAAIDTTEARIALYDRRLNLEKARINYVKATLDLSNYLWLENNVPIELQDNIVPNTNTILEIDSVLSTSEFDLASFDINTHPKMLSLDYKYEGLDIQRRLTANNLLPTINLEYNFLSDTPEAINSFNTSNYKSGVNISLPLFLRKERADLKLAKLKMQDTEFEIEATKVTLKNKISAIDQELDSYVVQNDYNANIVTDYEKLLSAEERKFFLGESSIFLVNSRESKLIDAKLKAINLEYKFFETKAKLFNVLSTLPF